MEDGTVSIFGLIFGVAATTTDPKTIAGASGAVAAAVSMMAGVYLDAETTRDETQAIRASSYSAADSLRSLSHRLAKAGLTSEQSSAIAVAVQNDPAAARGLLRALQGAPETPLNPLEQALWMLLADFLAAAVPILPFVFFPIQQARIISGVVTVVLLVGLVSVEPKSQGATQFAPYLRPFQSGSPLLSPASQSVCLSTICSPARWVLNRAGLLSVHDSGLSHVKLTEDLNVG
jgi:VIT1/CCC1 family predicted Fe2+/Mn2+ transporter